MKESMCIALLVLFATAQYATEATEHKPSLSKMTKAAVTEHYYVITGRELESLIKRMIFQNVIDEPIHVGGVKSKARPLSVFLREMSRRSGPFNPSGW